MIENPWAVEFAIRDLRRREHRANELDGWPKEGVRPPVEGRAARAVSLRGLWRVIRAVGPGGSSAGQAAADAGSLNGASA
jgi:hypothetical protein